MDSIIEIFKVHPKVSIPVLVLILKVVMKLFVGREAKYKHFLEMLYELPTDIIFLAISFSFVYFFLDDVTDKRVIEISVALIIVAILVIVLIRQCRNIGDSTMSFWKGTLLVVLIVVNYFISTTALYYSSSRLLNDPTIKDSKHIELKKTEECK